MASTELAQKLQRRLLRDGSCCSEESARPPGEGERRAEEALAGHGHEVAAAAAAAAAPAGSESAESSCCLSLDADAEDQSVLNAAADPELSAKLSRRQDINAGAARPRLAQVFNPYTEFKEFTRRQIKDMERLFRLYDSGKDGYIDLMELKLMMEKLGAPQTHLGLKNMIKEVDEDFDGKLSFREFLLIFHKAAAGELEEDSGLMALAKLSEIDVALEGVKGAKSFFEAKVQALSSASKFEAEIKAEQDERKREEEERRHRRAAFRELKSAFSQ